jgi:hypothetical protein
LVIVRKHKGRCKGCSGSGGHACLIGRISGKFRQIGRAKAIYLDDWTGEEPWIKPVPLKMVAELMYKYSPEIGAEAMEQHERSELTISRYEFDCLPNNRITVIGIGCPRSINFCAKR